MLLSTLTSRLSRTSIELKGDLMQMLFFVVSLQTLSVAGGFIIKASVGSYRFIGCLYEIPIFIVHSC